MKRLLSLLLVLTMLFSVCTLFTACDDSYSASEDDEDEDDSDKEDKDSDKDDNDDNIGDDSGNESLAKPDDPSSDIAITVGSQSVSAAQMNYFYCDAITTFCNQFSSYGEYADFYLQIYTGFDTSKSVDAQIYDQETGETWADYFISEAKESARWVYAMYARAMSEGFILS